MHILLIEDSPGEARLIQEMLSGVEDLPSTTEVADCLSAGLTRLAEGKVDAVLLDLTLPDSGGLETLDAVQARAPNVPVVILSDCSDPGLALEAIRRGAQDFLMKGEPDRESLVRSVRYAIERHRCWLSQETARAEPVAQALKESVTVPRAEPVP